jgi:hypothetical protein
MPAVNLETFQIDCKKKEEQIRFLQSLRSGQDDKLAAGVTNMAKPWTRYTNPDEHNQRVSVHKGYSNWLINQNLMRLSWDCP